LAGAVIAGLAFRTFNAAPAVSDASVGAAAAGNDADQLPAVEEFVAAREADPKPATKDAKTKASEAQEFFDGKRG
jgi:aquaporin Z